MQTFFKDTFESTICFTLYGSLAQVLKRKKGISDVFIYRPSSLLVNKLLQGVF